MFEDPVQLGRNLQTYVLRRRGWIALFGFLQNNTKMALKASLAKRLKNIRMLVLDVDGVLTDCRTYMDADGEWRRLFSIRDGYGIMRIRHAGFKVAVVTGTKARDIQERVKALKVDYFYEGHLEKRPCLEELSAKSGYSVDQMAYMGDDHFDVPVLKLVGFAATVSDAMEEVFPHVHYVAKRPAGNGAVREVCEMLLQAQTKAAPKSRAPKKTKKKGGTP